MKKNSLTPNNGLSLSQAQSISNLCNQRAIEITNQFVYANNYSKTIFKDVNLQLLQKARPLPTNVVELLNEKAKLHATQAFLMENIKAKDVLLKEIKSATADLSSVVYPEEPERIHPHRISNVAEDWGWNELTTSEISEYTEAEAFASHIGQFIHKDGVLTHLRSELPEIPDIEWFEVKKDEKTPVSIHIHHTPEQLLKLHEELAALHRGYEQKVNYFKAKVKNLTTNENARIANLNADAQHDAEKQNKQIFSEYENAYKAAAEAERTLQAEFEKTRQTSIKEVASMRILVDQRFDNVVKMFLDQLPKSEE